MKLNRLRLVSLFIVGLLWGTNVFSQIAVTPSLTALQLAEIFAGSNLTVSNAVLTGSPSAVASFTSSSGFDYSSGIVLCTGLATNAPGPNNDPNTGDNLSTAGDPLLAALGGAASRDAVVLEFDFVVQSASVQFNYIFASEEYPEFAPPNQPEFTDVFAFYISGPGITGEENIALVPGTSLAVNIQNINAVTNQQYYIDNASGQAIQFDGYTTDLVASKSGLTPCQTYHLKLMISDIRTSVRNSAVFFKENSFVQESTLAVSTQTIQADNTAREGCVQGSFTFKIPAPEPTDRIISFTIGGTAVNGVDYQHIDNSLTIPAGDTTATVFINPFSDGISEGQETVVFDFSSGGCSGSGTTSMFIDDSEPISFTLDQVNLTCNADNSGQILVDATGGFPPYNFTYTTGGVSNVATASPITGLAAGTYTVGVTDAYGCKAEALVIGGLFNAGTTFLPDGNGVTYEAPLTISGFGATDVIQNVNQIQQVCMTLEHSYLGDLTIDLVSPSGEVISLKGFGGNSADLGEPVATGPFDDGLSSDPTPGNGYEYCFNANPTFGTMNSESGNNFRTNYTDNVGNVYSDNYLPAGSYAADGNFSSLLGSALNGTWKLRVTDNAELDNGYIFNWYVSLIGDLPDSIVTLTQPAAISISGVSQNATCGTPNGAINTTVANAANPYTVLWSTGELTEDLTSLNAGTYSITVTDNNTCTASSSFNVSNTSSIGVASSITAVSCLNGTDGAIDVTVSGGQSPYAFSWSNGAVSEDISSLAPGSYTLTVTDQQNCVKISTFTVPNATPISISLLSSQNEICGTDNGALNISASGGTGSFGYSWSNGANVANISGLTAGTYTVTVTDGFSCTASTSYTLVNDISNCSSFCFLDAQLDALTDETCGQQNGGIALTVLNAVSPYALSWSNGQTTEDINGLAAGTYTVSITDANACAFSTSFTVANNTGNLALTQAITDENCGNNQGAVDISVSGGNLPYSFSWSNGATSEDISALSAGTYDLILRDGNNCEISQSFMVAANPGSLSVSGVTAQSFCNSNNGSITQTVSGASGLLSFLWNTGQTSQNRSNLAPGTYSCTITDALGCSVQKSYTITESTGNISLLGSNTTNETCGNAGGAIDLTATGTSLTYLWSNGATTQDISGLTAGVYSCVITNDQGCNLSTGNIQVANSTGGLSVSAQLLVPEVCSANNGSININLNSGTAPYSFAWSNGATTEDITALAAGVYTVNVTDNVGCVKSQSFTVSGNQGTLAISNAVLTNENCGNGAGAINVTSSGGSMPLSYLWSNGAITEDVNALSAGDYDLTVSDVSGCSVSASYTISNQTSGLTVSTQLTNEICGNAAGAIDLTVSGGNSPYTFVWSNASLNEDLTGLAAGTYSCIVTDDLGCSFSTSNLVIGNSSNGLSATTAVTDASCTNDGAVNLSVSGGQVPYLFAWSNGAFSEDLTNVNAGSYSCTVTDANGCEVLTTATVNANNNNLAYTFSYTDEICANGAGTINLTVSGGNGAPSFMWSNTATTEDLSGLSTGTYTCVISDLSGCSITTAPIAISNQSNSLQVLALTAANEVCGNAQGTVNLTVSGGTQPYTYLWSNGAVSEDLSALASGVYQVTISDQLNCSATAQITVGNTSGTLALNLQSLTDEKCSNASGSIQLTTAGGTSPYTYSWSNGAVSEDLTNLSAGSYSVSVQDISGCSLTKNYTISNLGADLAIGSSSVTDENCGNHTGAINISINGGNAPYSYSWSNGAGTEDLSALAAGIYTLQVQDANGCVLNASFTVANQNGSLSATGTAVNENCGDASGSISVNVSGGTSPYLYSWSSGQISEDLVGLSAGNYALTVTDNIGCTASYAASITNITNGLSLALNAKTDENCGLSNGAIDITTSGSGIITYLWSNGALTEDISGISAGNYTLTATDDLGCSVTISETIANQTGTLAISFTNIQSPLCGNSDGFIDIEVSGTGPFTYLWDDGSTNQDLLSLAAGDYDVEITDGLGCKLNQTFTVNSASSTISANAVITDANCLSATGAIDVTVLGGTAPFSFSWSNGAGSEDLNALAAGTYTVVVTDFYGCSTSNSFTVGTTNSTFSITNVFVQDEFCGFNDGGIFVNTSSPGITFTINGVPNPNEFFQNLSADDYLIEITDASGCTVDSLITVNSQANFTISSVVTDETCGQNNGAIDLTANDTFGQGLTFSYLWSDGPVTEDRTALAGGIYSVTISDDLGCSLSSAITVGNQTGSFVISASNVQTSNCGTATGSIDITVAGGTSPYSFSWSNGAITEDISALLPGTYTVTIDDAASCSLSQSFAVSDSYSVSAIVVNPSCSASTGSIDLTVIGGVGPFTFAWSNGASSEDLSGLSAGTYDVIVTDDLGCTSFLSFTLTQQAAINITNIQSNPDFCSFGGGSIFVNATGVQNFYINGVQDFNFGFFNNLLAGTYTITLEDFSGCTLDTNVTVESQGNFTITSIKTDETCGNSNGAIDITANDIFAQGLVFTYQWSDGVSTEDRTALAAGTYSVTVTDNFGCVLSSTIGISNQTGGLAISSSNVQTSNCGTASGSIDITVTGGTSPYSFSWSNGAITEDISALLPGSYTVTVSDASSCSFNQTFVVNNSFDLSGTFINPGCTATNGSINLTVNGGTSPYTFAWSNGASSEDLSGLSAGTYDVTVTDDLGCSSSLSFTLTQQAAINIVSIQRNPDFCSFGGGSIFVNASGVQNYYINGVQDFNFGFFNNLLAGTYTITLEDFSGCTLDTNVTVDDQGNFTITSINTDEICGNNNGAIDITANDIFAQGLVFTYQWSDGVSTEDRTALAAGTYTVTVTDNFGCALSSTFNISNQTGGFAVSNAIVQESNCGSATGSVDITITGGTAPYTFLWSNGAITEDISSLLPGTYSVEVTDASSCSLTQTFAVLNSFRLSAEVTDASCTVNDGAIDITVNTGVAPFTFAWSNGASSEDLNNLAAGTYTLTVTDNVGCSLTESYMIEALPGINLFNVQINPPFCSGNNGFIFVNAFGVANYYLDGVLDPNFGFFQNLAEGTYTITLEDINGCTLDTAITLNGQGNFTFSGVVSNDNCGAGIGAVNVTANDPFALGLTFTYDWSNGSNTEDLSNLTAGDYTLTITDNFGCSLSDSYTVANQTGGFGITASNVTQSHCGNPDGAIDLTVSGGTTPYSISWSNGATTEDISGLVPGVYTVTISDATSCTVSQDFTISNDFFVTGTVISSSCGNNNGSVNLTVATGVGPYTFSWSNGAVSEDLINLAAGTYSVNVTDALGCTTSASFTVNETLSFTLNQIQVQNDICNLGFGSIDIFNSGVVNEYYIDGVANFGNSNFSNLTVGNYLITLEDLNGCTLDTLVSVGFQASFTPSFVVSEDFCGTNTGAIDMSVTDDFGIGGTFSYTWSTGANSEDLTGLGAGVYNVTILHEETSFGFTCADSYDVIINSSAAFTVATSSTDETCNDGTGAIDVTVDDAGAGLTFTYLWNTGAVTEDLTGLNSGTYTITVSDQNGCALSKTATISNINTLNFLGSTILAENCGLNDGSIDINVSGINPLTYSWSNGAVSQDVTGLSGGNYSVIVTDANNCVLNQNFTVPENTGISVANLTIESDTCLQGVGSILLTASGTVSNYYIDGVLHVGSYFDNLSAGNHQISIENAAGCTLDTVINVPNSGTFTVVTLLTHENCGNADGAINVVVAGGSTPYTFVWAHGPVTEDLTGLSAGTYSVLITDNAGCQLNVSSVIQNNTGSLSIASATITDAFCEGASGAIDVTPIGGTTPYSYLWSNGSVSQDVTGLLPGTYTFTLTDNSGCSLDTSFVVNSINAINFVSVNVSDEVCGAANGSISITTQGVVTEYYLDGVLTTGPNFNNLNFGVYTVTISNGAGCSLDSIVTVGSSASFAASAVLSNEGCGQDNGAIDLTIDSLGLSLQLTYVWSNGATTQDISSLSKGTYLVNITNIDGCVLTRVYSIDSLVAPFDIPTFAIDTATCASCSDGAIDLTIANSGAYTFLWSNGATTEDLAGVLPGIYTLTLTNIAGCDSIISVEVPAKGSGEILFMSPNPATGVFEVEVNFPNGESGKLYMYDMLGQIVYESPEIKSSKLQFNADEYGSAFYFFAARSTSVFEKLKFEIIK